MTEIIIQFLLVPEFDDRSLLKIGFRISMHLKFEGKTQNNSYVSLNLILDLKTVSAITKMIICVYKLQKKIILAACLVIEIANFPVENHIHYKNSVNVLQLVPDLKENKSGPHPAASYLRITMVDSWCHVLGALFRFLCQIGSCRVSRYFEKEMRIINLVLVL